MEKFIPYEKLSKKGSDTTAASGGLREWSEWHLPGTATGTSERSTKPDGRPGVN